MRNFFLILSVIVCTSSMAYANCEFNNKSYPTGYKLGQATCLANGSWSSPPQTGRRTIQKPQIPQPQLPGQPGSGQQLQGQGQSFQQLQLPQPQLPGQQTNGTSFQQPQFPQPRLPGQ